jgi:hypothetical protein
VTDYTRANRVVRVVVGFKTLEVTEGSSTRSLKPRDSQTFMSNGERDEAVDGLHKQLLKEGWAEAKAAAAKRTPRPAVKKKAKAKSKSKSKK